MASHNDPRTWWIFVVFLVALFVVLLSIVATAYYIPWLYYGPTNVGEFGDMFGGANALFSGLAFVGVIVAILLQSQELHLQRRDLKLTQEELRGQKEQLEAQNATFRRQTFDNAFFQMLSLHNQIVNSIDLEERESTTSSRSYSGRDCFVVFHDRFKKMVLHSLNTKSVLLDRDLIEEAYSQLFQTIQTDTGHYFRYLYNVVKFVDESDIDDKQRYTNLIRAQLSSDELMMLFYNCSVGKGKVRFKRLVEKYALLENLPEGKLYHPSHREWFQEGAFEEQTIDRA